MPTPEATLCPTMGEFTLSVARLRLMGDSLQRQLDDVVQLPIKPPENAQTRPLLRSLVEWVYRQPWATLPEVLSREVEAYCWQAFRTEPGRVY